MYTDQNLLEDSLKNEDVNLYDLIFFNDDTSMKLRYLLFQKLTLHR